MRISLIVSICAMVLPALAIGETTGPCDQLLLQQVNFNKITERTAYRSTQFLNSGGRQTAMIDVVNGRSEKSDIAVNWHGRVSAQRLKKFFVEVYGEGHAANLKIMQELDLRNTHTVREMRPLRQTLGLEIYGWHLRYHTTFNRRLRNSMRPTYLRFAALPESHTLVSLSGWTALADQSGIATGVTFSKDALKDPQFVKAFDRLVRDSQGALVDENFVRELYEGIEELAKQAP